MYSIRTRILGSFTVLILLQALVAFAVWRAESRVDVASAADVLAQERSSSIAGVTVALHRLQGRLSDYLRTGAASDRTLVDDALAAVDGSIGTAHEEADSASSLGTRLDTVRQALKAVMSGSVARRDAAAALALGVSEIENAMVALARAVTRAPDRTTLETLITLLTTDVQPVRIAERYAVSGDPLDGQLTREAAAKALDEVNAWLRDSTTTTPRIERLVKTLAGALEAIRPLAEKLGEAVNARNQNLTRLEAEVGQAQTLIARTQQQIAEERKRCLQDTEQARTAVRQTVLAAAAATCLVGIALAALLSASITRPTVRLANVMRRLAAGSLNLDVPGRSRRDEVGGMSAAVQVFKDNMIRANHLDAEQTRLKAEAAAAQKAALNRAADGFDAKLGTLIAELSSAATDLHHTAGSMSDLAEHTHGQASAVALSASNAGNGVQTVAAAAEQLTASIGEINRQMAQSARVTGRAVDDARRTNGIVTALADSAKKIGEIVGVISGIAAQTNLLALNATIEAARAGDAGRGFAVVASEVKTLAGKTAQATDDIGAQIEAIQTATAEAVNAIGAIGMTIDEVSVIASSISAAVEQQGVATQEIARNVQLTATSTQEVTSTIADVSQAADRTGSAAGRVLQAAGTMLEQSRQLTTEVGTFVAGIRAA